MTSTPLPAAPGETLHTSLALANSAVTLTSGQHFDELGNPQEATTWLIDHGLVPSNTALLSYCQQQLTGLRETLRIVFSAQVEGQTPAVHALEHLNTTMTAAPGISALRFSPGNGFARESVHPVSRLVEHAMSQLADDAAKLLSGDQAQLLAQCAAAPCDRFLLRTHARRHWCSIRCGDRVRAARAYARKNHGTTPGD
ncbi:hypothetical protein C5E07_16405 [Pseudoclavibacter sp. RFBJ3]|uniref:ABATE domain-containing protein n=1 Tax=unclassified Pseudoclavibacter TaxID=2615177 RepID=UPI000CE90C73|nr:MULTISPECIES: ABATE domain-containing protein [unclassified Pseudoclavibacter]PPF87522.1 hypothetical protein C5C12_00215 [Pseudoclavibacter sp. RFBJ5]PPF90372.1 hypothetical protein C5E07_16405 [Pseudoclavibacter sp. RFBJ3]PPG01057.1 hypothetical protein C5C19_00215 [Pseudoclavibacter sp. RFBH5]PPG26160.1 hypothetical protein C5E13_00170 [Pseudoclavibacter sp. RFBI4]